MSCTTIRSKARIQSIQMKKVNWMQKAPLSMVALVVLSACGSSSSNRTEVPQVSQAIDGYIVGGSVFCDGEDAGQTTAGGFLTCPEGTEIATVRGGMDVGFDDSATSSDNLFIGELNAPGDLGYVTPLSTIAVQMASASGEYDPDLWESSVADLGSVLGSTTLDLSADASKDMGLIRLNAQLQQVMSAFVRSDADYSSAIAALSNVVVARAATGATVDLQGDVAATITTINAALLNSASPLALTATEIDTVASSIQEANIAIAMASSPSLAAAVSVGNSVDNTGVIIDRRDEAVELHSVVNSQSVTTGVSIDDFEDSSLAGGVYLTQVGKGLQAVSYDNGVLQFSEDLDDLEVTMGFELKPTLSGDTRSLSFYSDEVMLNAMEGDSDSLVITLPDGAVFKAMGTDSLGTVTTAEVSIEGEGTFSNSAGRFSVNYSDVLSKLESIGFEDIFSSAGNYEMTLVIGGIALMEKSGSSVVPAERYSITVGARNVNGSGFKGYLSYTH